MPKKNRLQHKTCASRVTPRAEVMIKAPLNTYQLGPMKSIFLPRAIIVVQTSLNRVKYELYSF